MATNLTNENVVAEVEQSTTPVVVDVFASWCGPCQQMAPIFHELEEELKSSYKFAELNVDEARETSIKYGITSVPTFLFFKGGKLIAKEMGFMSKEDLKQKINKHLG